MGTAITTKEEQVITKSYYFKKVLKGTVVDVKTKLVENIKKIQFGVVSELNLHEKFKEKLDVDFPAYVILGICNPKIAYEAVMQEEYIGLFLPCKVLLKAKTDNTTEVAILNPEIPLGFVGNQNLVDTGVSLAESLKGLLSEL